MALGVTRAVSLVGLHGYLVEVQAHLSASVPGFALVGLPDAALSEARDRVRAAVSSAGLTWPQRKITVNLCPASLPKAGSAYDLAIAVAILAGKGIIDPRLARDVVHIGELGLDGRLQPVRGVLPAVAAAVSAGYTRVVVPADDEVEARLVPGAEVLGAVTLAQIARHYGADCPEDTSRAAVRARRQRSERTSPGDLRDVLGQGHARHALEVAAAGGHHLFMVGPAGAGKTMLASRLPGILPDLDEEAAVEVTAIHSVAGTFDPGQGLIHKPPFEDPHHTATSAAIVGGGSGVPRPGAASRAHRGVLFLDEAPEFGPRVLQTLRQPLENGELVIHRANATARFPARFQLILAANPCPCGKAVGKALDCTCTSQARRRYFSRLSGPLLDRVDVQIDVPAIGRADRVLTQAAETSAVVASRVAQARQACAERLRGTPWRTNAEVPGPWLRERLGPGRSLLAEIDRALDRGTLTLRGADRVLKVAWTVADLEGRPAPTRCDIGQGLALRSRGVTP